MRVRRTAIVALGAVLAMTGLAGCNNTKTSAAECAYVIQNGYFDAKHIQDIVLPGNRVNTHNTQVSYVPCNARNFIITTRKDVGDRSDPVRAKTAADLHTSTPAMPVVIQLTAYFQLNQHDKEAMKDFYGFCQKYDCFGSADEISHSANFASDGWRGLLRENFSFAIDRTAVQAVQQFGPDLWNNRAEWPKVADMLSTDFANQIKTSTGSKYDYFCASGAGTECKPVRFTIEDIEPADPAVKAIYDQQVLVGNQKALSLAQKAANQAALDAAKAKYGPNAGAILGQLDVINACKSTGGTCVVSVGGAAVTVPAK